MQGRTLMQTCLFRLLAVVLLAISAGFVVLPESNPYSADKTFVKSHAPATDSFASMLRADDKEDVDEDQAMDVQLLADFSTEFISLVGCEEYCKIKVRPIGKMNYHQAYIRHRQLLI
jgi:hypothetical protein